MGDHDMAGVLAGRRGDSPGLDRLSPPALVFAPNAVLALAPCLRENACRARVGCLGRSTPAARDAGSNPTPAGGSSALPRARCQGRPGTERCVCVASPRGTGPMAERSRLAILRMARGQCVARALDSAG